ncbi:MAG: adenylate/guanylate cyclase domain-containing protein [Syntrophaceae bacterium]
MPPEESACTILFADISGSTRLYEDLGDASAHRLVNACIEVLTRVVAEHRGVIVKTIGDEVMCTFADEGAAVQAAIGMHKAVDAMPPILTGKAIRPNIRIGLHAGPVIRQGLDVFGDSVNVAARMVSLAKPRQIITTSQVLAALPASSGVTVVCVDRTTVKGKGGDFLLYEIVWEEDTQTIILSKDQGLAVLGGRLRIRHGQQEVFVDKDRPSVTLGRQAQNDLVVNDSIASRVHARIEYQRGKFMLIDVSANGTYVRVPGEELVFIHHEELALGPSGIIGLGRACDQAAPDAVHFACLEGQAAA